MLSKLFRRKASSPLTDVSRRDLLAQSGLLAAATALPVVAAPANKAAAAASTNANAASTGAIYRAIGVRPLINGRGTFTIITGSQTLPEVKKAMDEASRSFVQMDELMAGVGKRLAELTGAEWGMVSNGCCAAVANLTAAAIAGSNPERMQQLPDLTGMKNEVIIPEYSRNVYDHAVRMVGTKIITVTSPAEMEAAFNERTAMVYILGGPGDEGPLGTQVIAAVAKRHNVPVVVDAAAEILTFPNVHLQRGANAVVYSGGKCIRGPQAAGLVLGDKNWLQATWLNSAPHHAYGRALKVGKEEIMGMLTAVETWKKRDHDAEWKRWDSWLTEIATSVKTVNGVTTSTDGPDSLSNRSPRLIIKWDGTQVGITGQEVAKILLDEEPRIVVGSSSGARPDSMSSSVSITPYQMMPGDSKIIAERLTAVLSKPPKFANPEFPTGQASMLAGQWETTLEFTRGSAVHQLILEQNGDKLLGTHNGEYGSGDLSGSVAANYVRFRSGQKIHGTRLTYDFTGTVEGEKMSGTVAMGEYGEARWSAVRHQYKAPNGVMRPIKRS